MDSEKLHTKKLMKYVDKLKKTFQDDNGIDVEYEWIVEALLLTHTKNSVYFALQALFQELKDDQEDFDPPTKGIECK